MRLLLLPAALLLVACAAAPGLAADDNAPTAPLPAEALKLAEVFRTEVAKATQQYADSIRMLPSIQQSQLANLQKKLQDTGDLDGYLAVSKEAKRFAEALKAEPDPFEKIPELPESALVDKPEALRTLQDQYIKAHKDKADVRVKQVEELARSYASKMGDVVKDLTIKGRIHDAVAAKKEMERIKKGLEDKSFVQQALSAAPVVKSTVTTTTPVANETPATNDVPVYGHAPEWSKWQFDRSASFAGGGFLFAHPDLPDQLTIDFNPKNGRGRLSGRCEIERQTIDMRECSWFGKAVQWRVKDFASLNATILLQSKEIAAGQGYGPKAYVMLLNDKGPIGDVLEATMLWKEMTLTIAKDPDSSRCTLGWPQGKVKKTIDLPASGGVRVLFGIALRNQGERCDTFVTMQ
jgi:hypothetical protein